MNHLKRLLFVIIVVILSNSTLFCQKLTRSQYIELFKEFAIKEMTDYGIPASITLAQACLESADGNSRLAKEGNNHFGIKCSNWAGDTLQHHDDKRSECFRKYKSASESFVDHSLFLASKERYSSLFKLEKTDYKSWAYGLKAAGYATNPQYAEQLIKIIEDFSLYQFDNPDSEKKNAKITSQYEEKTVIDSLKSYETGKNYDFTVTRTIQKVNKVKYIISGISDSYEELAKEFNLFTKEILSFNDLIQESELKPGTLVFIEKKKKKNYGNEKIYIVTNNDTYYSISQKFGIRLKYLLKINSLHEGDEAKEGKTIKLK